MLFLIVILAVCCVVLLAAVLLARPALPQRGSSEDDPFISFHFKQSCDPDEAVVWDTQVPVLHLVDSADEDGVPMQMLYRFYVGSCVHYPELYDGSTFEGWIECLERNQLIEVHGGRVWLQKHGREFLHHRATRVRQIDRRW